MIWLIRIGLGVGESLAPGVAMSWDELLLTPAVDQKVARQHLEHVLNDSLNAALTALGAIEPILMQEGPKVRCALSARGRIQWPYLLDLTVGPAEVDCHGLGHAIGIARQTAKNAIDHLAGHFDGRALRLAAVERKLPLPQVNHGQ